MTQLLDFRKVENGVTHNSVPECRFGSVVITPVLSSDLTMFFHKLSITDRSKMMDAFILLSDDEICDGIIGKGSVDILIDKLENTNLIAFNSIDDICTRLYNLIVLIYGEYVCQSNHRINCPYSFSELCEKFEEYDKLSFIRIYKTKQEKDKQNYMETAPIYVRNLLKLLDMVILPYKNIKHKIDNKE